MLVSIDLLQELEKVAPEILNQPGTFGSVILRFTSSNYRNLRAAVMVHEMGQPIGYHIDAFAEDPDYSTGSREGIWWLPRAGTKDNLIISNASEKPNQGMLFLYDAAGRGWKQNVQLGPRQSVRVVVGDLVAKAGLSGTYGGMKFVMVERAGYIDTVHFVYDETAGFSALMKMYDHDPKANLEQRVFDSATAWTTRAPMLALESPDPALALPSGIELQPKIFVRNTIGAPLPATVKLSWRGGRNKGMLTLPAIRLRANETRLIDVAALQENGQIPKDAHWAMVQISAPGKPDDLMARVVAVLPIREHRFAANRESVLPSGRLFPHVQVDESDACPAHSMRNHLRYRVSLRSWKWRLPLPAAHIPHTPSPKPLYSCGVVGGAHSGHQRPVFGHESPSCEQTASRPES